MRLYRICFALLLLLGGLTASGQTKYAVVVGVADYRNPDLKLRYCDDDAYRFYAYLMSCKGGGAMDHENVACLIDEAATKANILKTMDKIFANATKDDMLIFYFSGHGTEGAFCPHDTQKTYASLLTHKEIKAVFKKHPARHKVVFSDACHAGSIYEGLGTSQEESNTASQIQTDVLLMMSSRKEETSQETARLRQGAFSYYLLKGLKGAADRDNDNQITLRELFPYVKANVMNFTRNRQTPFIEGSASPDMLLAY